MSSKSRNRGRILTPEGLGRLQQAIRAWESENEMRCTQEKLRELTIAEKPPNGLDPGTIRKILEAEKAVDPKSIRCLFKTLGLELDEADLVASSRSQLQVDSNFVGRERAIDDLTALVNRDVKVIVIQARGGVGKTTLARKYLQQEFGSFLEFPIAKEAKDIASIESLIEEKLRQLGEEPGREFFVSLDRLKRKLQNERIGILIDNLEPALDSAGKFIEPHRRYVELLRVLADPSVQSTTLITTRERLRESSITVENYILRSLDLTAWEQFFQSRNLSTDTLDFAALHNAYGGNAKAMDIIRSAILEDYAGDIEAYWQANQHDLFIERDLEDLVTQQFDRLQQIDADAYNLLCRMGCYRYQDVPTVPIEGLLCLLWDVPENRQRRVVKSLQDRSLVEFANGEYSLHPVIRAEAVKQLRIGDEWEIVNQKVAEFWTLDIKNIESVADALRALEAYYHYINISDFEMAASIVLRERDNKWQKAEFLGVSLFRLGLFQKLPFSLKEIAKCVKSDYHLCGIYHLIADSYALEGKLRKAIELFEFSGKMANESESNYFNLASLQNIAICRMELGETEIAMEYFNKIIELTEKTEFHRHRTNAKFCLAFLNSCQSTESAKQKATELAQEVKEKISTSDSALPVDLTVWGKGYSWLFLGSTYRNLGRSEEAVEAYHKALDFAEECKYPLVQADALRHLAVFYREQQDIESALSYHNRAIILSESVGSKTDLAESHYQLGLTYKVTNELAKSLVSFQEAIRLFNEMEAPKQVERVRRSMNNPE